MSLQGKVALVTGGAQRLGRAIGLALAAAGADLMIHYYSSADAAKATLASVRAHGVRAALTKGDLMRVEDAEEVVDTTLATFERLDLLVCNAGIWGATPLGSVSPEQWDRLYALNARAPFFMAQRAAPHLRATQGCVVATVDAGIHWAWKNYTPYLSSKAALAMVVQNLARDMAPDVRVNGVAPGPVLLPDDWTEEQRARVAATTLLKRLGSAEDVAAAVVYLASASYVTGVVLPVDGGQRLV